MLQPVKKAMIRVSPRVLKTNSQSKIFGKIEKYTSPPLLTTTPDLLALQKLDPLLAKKYTHFHDHESSSH